MPIVAGLILILIFFTLLGMAATAWGVDSSDSSNDPRRPADRPGLT